MRPLRQVFLGLITALASIALLLGGFSLSLVEGNKLGPEASGQPPSTSTRESFTATPIIFTPTRQAFPSPMASSTPPPPSATPSLPPAPTSCPTPAGWVPYQVQPGDSFDSLAARYSLSPAELGQANCNWSLEMLPGGIIYVPPAATPTIPRCGPPSNWVKHIVRRGETLYGLSKTYGTTVADLQRANCLTGNSIRTGQVLFIPPGNPTPLPGSSGTPIVIIFDTPTDTPTDTPAETPTDSP
jgi:LysM repeat protein